MSHGNSNRTHLGGTFCLAVSAVLLLFSVTSCASSRQPEMEKASTAPNEKMQNGAPASGGASSGGAASAGAGGTIERDGNESAEAPWWEIKTSTENIVEGNNYFKKGEYQKAEIAYRKALKKDPNNPTAINN